MIHRQYTKEEMLEALKKAHKNLTPLQHFKRMVDTRLIDENGKVLWDRKFTTDKNRKDN